MDWPATRSMRAEQRRCACGCGTTFVTTNPHKRYVHALHRPPKPSSAAHHTPDYKQRRAALFATPPNGAPCPRCREPMTNEQWANRDLHAGHTIDVALGGEHSPLRYEHNDCGFSAGATQGNRTRLGWRPSRTSRRWRSR